MPSFLKKSFKSFVNIPIVWYTLQYLVGANAFKYVMYPSVFKSRSGKLLDFGCSSGNTTSGFLTFEYWGVDTDREAIVSAAHRFSHYPNIHFEYADLSQGPYKEAFFDHILFAGTAHHLTSTELPTITKHLIASLKSGGEFHFYDPIIQSGKDGFITKLFLKYDQGKNMRTREELEFFFKTQGYDITESKIFSSPKRFLKLPDHLYVRVVKQ